nr:helix-hairpin-helix domain-containing protein [uncultured Dyadobacter sp.]
MKQTYAFDLRGSLAVRCQLCLALLLTITCPHCSAQEPPRPEIDINAFIAELFPIPPEDSDASELYESLLQLYASPLDLNAATADDLSATFILSEKQLRSLLDYRAKFGPLLSLYELQAVPDLDLETIRRLLPFVTISKPALSLRESVKNPGQHFLMFRSGKILERQKGFSPPEPGSSSTTRYRGSAFNGYLRYRNARTGSHSVGLTLEKDAGEKLWTWQPRRQIFGIDFLSFHMQIMNRGKLKNLVIGDFQMQAGQGMITGAGFSLGKGSEVIQTTYRSTTGIKPYTSSTEANFFRGAAATISVTDRTDVTTFFSLVKRDATQERASDDQIETVTTSLPLSGYHRTPSEIDKHHVLTEWNAGLHLLHQLRSRSGQVGLSLLQTHYSDVLRKRDLPYNRHEFSGKQNFIAGLHGDYRWQNFHFFGESAVSRSSGLGALGGAIVSLGKKWDCSVLLRHYARNFHTFYGNSLSEATRPINETGAYAGLRFAPRHWQFSAFYDYFHFPWLKYQVDAPSKGSDYLLRALWKPNKRFNASLLFHEKHKQGNEPDSKEEPAPVVNSIRRTAMLNLEYDVPMKYALRTRFQCGGLKYEGLRGSNGLTVLQDITVHLQQMEVSGRFAFFKTDNYDSRQYVYEKDMLYAFSIPAYYDIGTRHYLMLRYTLAKSLKLWVRWSQTRYRDLEQISSGLNEISGNKRSEIKLQIMYQL